MKRSARAAAIAFIAVAAALLGCASSRSELTLEDGRILMSSADGTLTVTVAGSRIPLFGEVRLEGGRLVFEPRFPFKPGVEYRAVFESPSGRRVEKTFSLPSPPPSPPTVVRAVFPSRDVLPENLLKFYLHFSAPMSRREAYSRVHLLDSAGRKVELPFLEIGEELWDRGATRLTLLFDPGRIKRGLKPREDSGPALEEGKSYTLVIDAGWPDAEGRPLKQGHRKPFTVVAPDDRQPDPKTWTLLAPKAGSREPLAVQLDESLDEAMLHRSLVVIDPDGKPVDGRIEIALHETRWSYLPAAPWTTGKHTLLVDAVLEDMSGNSIDRPFEVDVERPLDKAVGTKVLRLAFEPR